MYVKCDDIVHSSDESPEYVLEWQNCTMPLGPFGATSTLYTSPHVVSAMSQYELGGGASQV